jgi:hypothetical protein
LAKESLRPYGGSQNNRRSDFATPSPTIFKATWQHIPAARSKWNCSADSICPLNKELLELLVSLAADLFDFEVAPSGTMNHFKDWMIACN